MSRPSIIPDEINGRFVAIDSEGNKGDSFGNVEEGKQAIKAMRGLAWFEKVILQEALPAVFLTLAYPPLTNQDLIRLHLLS